MAIQNSLNITDTGIISADGSGAFTGRTLTAGTGIDLTNGDGVSGNPTITLEVPVVETDGGTGQTTYTTGDILYASAANTLSKLAVGSDTEVLTLSSGVPSWAAPSVGTVTSVSGTAGRVTSTGGSTPVIDIDAAYVGQASLTTLGTITTGTWNGSTIDEVYGGTGQTTYTTGDILYASAANTLSKLSAGSDDEVLTLASGVPSWAAAAGGGDGWVFLSSATASSSATIDFTSDIDSTYNTYAFVFQDILPSTGFVEFRIRTSSNGGSSYDSGASDYTFYLYDAGGSSGSSYIKFIETLSTSRISSGIIFMMNPSASTPSNFLSISGTDKSSSVSGLELCSGYRDSNSAIDAVRFFMSSGDITSGTIYLYGVSKPS